MKEMESWRNTSSEEGEFWEEGRGEKTKRDTNNASFVPHWKSNHNIHQFLK